MNEDEFKRLAYGHWGQGNPQTEQIPDEEVSLEPNLYPIVGQSYLQELEQEFLEAGNGFFNRALLAVLQEKMSRVASRFIWDTEMSVDPSLKDKIFGKDNSQEIDWAKEGF